MKNKSRVNSNKNSSQQQKELQDIFENTLECVARLDVSGSFLSVNSNFAQSYAYQAEEMVGMLCKDTVHTDDATIFEEAYRQMLEQGRAEIDVRGIRKDSTVFYQHVVMVKGLSDDKSAIGHYCFVQDITERILNQQALRDQAKSQSEQLQSILALNLDAFVMMNSSGYITEWNPQAEKIFGWGKEEATGQLLSELIIPEHLREAHKQGLQRFLDTQEARILNTLVKISAINRQGIEFPVELTLSSLRQNEVLSFYAFIRDVSEARRLENLQAAERTILELIALGKEEKIILDQICISMEKLFSTKVKASVMVVNDDHLNVIAAPNCSQEVINGFDGLLIGDGSCGAAAERGEQVIVCDVQMDPLWEKFTDFATEHNISACWSTPCLSKQGELLGTFALSHSLPCSPDENDFELMQVATQLACIVIEKQVDCDKIKKMGEMYANAINLNPDAIYLTRLNDGLIIDVNEGFCKTSGYTRKEAIGKTTTELDLWIDIKDREEFVRQVKSYGKVQDLEIKFRKKNGEFSVVVISSVTVDVDGEPSIFTIAHSIDERIKTEQKLHASEEMFAAAVNASPDLVVITRLSDGMIQDVNESCLEFTGYTRDELIGKTTLEMDFYNVEDSEKIIEHLQKEGQYSQFESVLKRKDGTVRTTLSSAGIINLQNEPCIFAIIHDISQRKKEEENLLQIAKGVSAKIGKQFFTSLVEHLAQSLEVEYAFVASINPENIYHVTTIALYASGEHVNNIEYNLIGTPCEMVVGNEQRSKIFTNNIQQKFPKDKSLVTMGAESYAGAPLIGSSNQIMGLIVVISKQSFINPEIITSTLQIFASRAAAELERIQAHKELVTSEENFRRAIFSIPDSITLVTVEGGILVEVNEGFCQISGYSREEMIGQPIVDYWSRPEERENFIKIIQQQGFIKGFQHVFVSKDGKQVIGSISSVIIDYQGLPCIFSVTHDITQIKKAERELAASEEKFRSVFGNAPVGVALFDVNAKIIQANKIVTDDLGYEEKNLIGKTIADITLSDDLDESLDLFNKLIKGDIASYDMEKRYQTRLGELIWTQINVASVRDEKDGFLYAITHIVDISERKLSAIRLDRINRALRVLNDCNYGLTHITEERQLLQYICEVIINIGGYRFAWIGYAQDDKQKTVQPMANAGFEEGYLENVILWADKPKGRGPAGECIRKSSPQICKNINEDIRFKPWRRSALERGYRSVVALPLIIDSKVVGALMIYSSEIEVFDIDEVKLLSNLVENLAFGVRSARLKKESQLADFVLRNSEAKFRETFGNAPVGMVMVDPDGILIDANQAAIKLSGSSRQEFLGKTIAAITHPDDLEKSMKYFKDLWAGKIESYQIEKRYLHKDGHTIYCILHGSLVRDENDNPLFMIGQVEDITAKKYLNDVLTASEAKFKMLYHDTPAMFFNVDNAGIILSVNNFGAKHLGYTVDDLIGVDVKSIIHEEDRSSARENLKHCFEVPEQIHRWEIRKLKKDGEVIWVRESIRVVMDYDDTTSVFMVCEDITETYRLSQQLSYQATHDSLTGLANRAEFERRLKRIIKINEPQSSEHAICYLDLDQFKIINDTCGHLAGDELLRQLSELLIAKVRKRDTLARLGGDEFGVLMEHCDIVQARRVAESLRATVENFRFVWQDKKFSIGVSIGLVPISSSSGNVNDILSAADAACYAAKDAGRNRIHIYSSDDKTVAIRRGEMQWVSRINHALEEGLFKLYYQKIISVDGLKQGDHYELLLRMRGNNGELIPPGAFLSAAERYGLSNKIDSWVVNKAFTWLASHPAKLKKLHVCAINLSGQSLGNEEFMQGLLNSLDESGIPANKICFEITETSAIANLASAIRFINKFRSKGCLFALDDFGSGVSSFGYLKNLPVDYLKIDGSFVRDITNNKIDKAMVKSINEIGQIMGKETIAEFVENDAILKELKKLGVDYAQGYGMGKPRPLYYSKKAK
jgi:diguanylate cyclase (GGDEF)-like protein/PAS domain S-box-containing protein